MLVEDEFLDAEYTSLRESRGTGYVVTQRLQQPCPSSGWRHLVELRLI